MRKLQKGPNKAPKEAKVASGILDQSKQIKKKKKSASSKPKKDKKEAQNAINSIVANT